MQGAAACYCQASGRLIETHDGAADFELGGLEDRALAGDVLHAVIFGQGVGVPALAGVLKKTA